MMTLALPGRDVEQNSAKPHILLVIDQFPKTLGGGERVLLRLANLLSANGFRISIVTFQIHPESSISRAALSCPVYLIPLKRTYDLRAFSAAFAFRRFLREEHVLIVQTFFESSDIWAGLVTKALSRAKLIWSRRDMGILRDSKHRLAYRLMARLPDKVFAVSEQVRQYCIHVDRIDPARVITIYNGLDIAKWQFPADRSYSPGMITTVGNIRHVKGHDLLIRAAAIVLERFPLTQFNIAGEVLDQDFFIHLEALLHASVMQDRFSFLGNITDLPAHLHTADIFVLPSRSEGFSNAIIEAMAASLPVIATNVGGNAEAVEDGRTGFIVPPEDPQALADAIINLLQNPEQGRRMGEAGRQAVQDRFTTEAMLHLTIATYEDLLASK